MAGEPYSLGDRFDLDPAAAGFNVLNGIQGNTLKEDSLITLFGNRESVDVQLQFLVGSTEVYRLGPASINATVGDMPIIPDDFLVQTLGVQGDELFLLGSNVNVAAQELGYLIQVVSLADLGVMPMLGKVPGN